MPAKRKTKTDRMAEKFSCMYSTGKAITRLKDVEISEMLGLKSVKSLTERKKDPTKFRFGEILALSIILRWDEKDIVDLFALMQ